MEDWLFKGSVYLTELLAKEKNLLANTKKKLDKLIWDWLYKGSV